jgi:hypothetical protein
MTNEQVLKDALACPKPSKFSNVNPPAITAWRVTGEKTLTLLSCILNNISTHRFQRNPPKSRDPIEPATPCMV